MAELAKISDTIFHRILHENLGIHKVSAKWVLDHFSRVQKQRRVEYARSILELYDGDINPLLGIIAMKLFFFTMILIEKWFNGILP